MSVDLPGQLQIFSIWRQKVRISRPSLGFDPPVLESVKGDIPDRADPEALLVSVQQVADGVRPRPPDGKPHPRPTGPRPSSAVADRQPCCNVRGTILNS